jgi:hypothetical protein
VQNIELRPLGAGELLDRAVTLFVRSFVPIVLVLAAGVVPLIVLQAVFAPGSARAFSDFGTLLSAGANSAASRGAIADMSTFNASMGPSLVISLMAVVVRLLLWSSIVSIIATAYAGRPRETFKEAYEVGIRCWPAQVLVAIAFSMIGGAAIFPLAIVYLILIGGILALSAIHLVWLAVIFGVVVGVVLLIALVAGAAFVYMTYEIAAVYVVTEAPSPVAAITAAVRRAVSRGTWWRTMVGGLVIVAITQAGSLPLLGVAVLLTSLTHIDAVYFAIIGTGTILLDGLVAAFAVVYTTDMRVRREGLDLIALTG